MKIEIEVPDNTEVLGGFAVIKGKLYTKYWIDMNWKNISEFKRRLAVLLNGLKSRLKILGLCKG